MIVNAILPALLVATSSFCLIHSLGAISTENSVERRKSNGDNSRDILRSGEFVTDVLAHNGGTAVLPCKFTDPGIVTWIRRRDKQLLTFGTTTHSIDRRFVVLPDKPNWNLRITNVAREDAGIYECHIQTEPVQQRLIRLNITDAYSVIPGGPDLHVKQGSNLRLECRLMAAAETPSFIFWYRDNRMINYDDEPRVKIEATKNGSVLLIEKVRLSHGANYTCTPSNAKPTYVRIHVIEEEENPAAMHGGERRSPTATSSSSTAINVASLYLCLFSKLSNYFTGKIIY